MRPVPDFVDPDLSEFDRKLLTDVGKYGWSCLHISEADDPVYWTYTIGLFKSWRVPEIIIFGLSDSTAHEILSGYVQDIESGDTFEADKPYEVFEGGYEAMFLSVDPRWYGAFLGFGQWFYDYEEFPALQCVWPDKESRLPWEPGFDAGLPSQPLLISDSDAARLGYPPGEVDRPFNRH